MAKTIELTFAGYWREEKKEHIPKKSGVYLVYACNFNEEKSTVELTKLIYIGESENVNERVANHNKWSEWRKHLSSQQQICFSVAEVASPDRERAQCALIFYHKPPCCEQSTSSFDYEETTVISGSAKNYNCCEFIHSPITVKKT